MATFAEINYNQNTKIFQKPLNVLICFHESVLNEQLKLNKKNLESNKKLDKLYQKINRKLAERTNNSNTSSNLSLFKTIQNKLLKLIGEFN